MSNYSRFILAGVSALLLASCGGPDERSVANIDGVLVSAPSSEVVLQRLNLNELVLLDTLKTDEEGRFTYEVEVAEGQPEFFYIYSGGRKVASLLLEAGDNVSFTVDSLGVSEMEGSDESVRLMALESEHAAVLAAFADYEARLDDASGNEQKEIISQLGKAYQQYYRTSVRYVIENSRSMTAVQVLYRKVGDLPVFAQSTDAIIFSQVADSLETVYPDSKYVKSLRAEAQRRYNEMELQERLKDAEEVGYFDMSLPGLDGQKKTLSEVASKVTMIYFWSASDAAQNAFNVSTLKPLYEDYHSKGFEIYQVSLDTDKTKWATTVMGQNLPWVSVCDVRGLASPYVANYNLPSIPTAFLIADGELVDGDLVDEAALRKLLDKLLK